MFQVSNAVASELTANEAPVKRDFKTYLMRAPSMNNSLTHVLNPEPSVRSCYYVQCFEAKKSVPFSVLKTLAHLLLRSDTVHLSHLHTRSETRGEEAI